MDVDPSYTIIRIKRKRNEEPLDALLIESTARRKKSRNGLPTVQSIFQFAQTVEHDAWDDQSSKDYLKNHIDSLNRAPAIDAEKPAPSIPVPSSPIKRAVEERKYKIVQPPSEVQQPIQSRFPAQPPKIWSTKELEAKKNEIRMYDAVLHKDSSATMDPEMENFLPMLNDYLKLHDIDISDQSLSASSSAQDDYVYDVFYRTVGAPTAVSGNVATLTGLPAAVDGESDDEDEEVEDEADEDSNAEEYYKNDYPDEEEYDSDELHHEYNSASSDDDYYVSDADSEGHDWR